MLVYWNLIVQNSEPIWVACNIYVNESYLLAARGNSLIFIHDQSPAKRQLNKGVKSVGGISEVVNLPSCEGNESYKLLRRNQERNKSFCNILPFHKKGK